MAAQELEIAPFDQGDRIVDEAVGFAARVRILPLDRGKLGMVGAEHFRRDVARATAGVVDVEGMQELNQSPFLERREPQGGREKVQALAAKPAGEAQRDVESELEHAIERQKHGRPSPGLVILQADVEFVCAVNDHHFAPVGVRALDGRRTEGARIEGCRGVEPGRRRFKNQRGRRDFGQPQDGFGSDWRRGVMGENATPIAERD